MSLFKDHEVVGTFYGFSGGGLTPMADMLFMHNPQYPSSPVVGMPVLVRLDNDAEALLVRITSLVPSGSLASSVGNEYVMRNIRQNQYDIPENIRETKLIYRVEGRPLGILREIDGKARFVPSHRRIPPLGSPVVFAKDDLFRIAMNAADTDKGVEIGFAALGEFVWGDVESGLVVSEDAHTYWVVEQVPTTKPRFDVAQLVARRSFAFAKAGYGKSNLVKLLFSELYRDGVPVHRRTDGEEVPVGTLVGDLDGEYFWPSKDVPGFADVKHLRDHLVVFTERTPPNASYGSFKAGGVRLDVRDVSPGRLFPLVLPKDRLSATNVSQVMGLDDQRWRTLVDLVHPSSSFEDVSAHLCAVLRLDDQKSAELAIAGGAYRNTRQVLQALHDPDSTLLDDLHQALREGKLCVLDLSLFRARAQALLGIVLNSIFEHNMRELTTEKADVVPVIAVIEEAQNVLNGNETDITRPFIEFAKEGRKFHCGIFGITQQPGMIDDEILSQGDNFFVFHLLSEGDLTALRKANPHFSTDLLSSLLNEPLVGSGYFFSLYSSKQYPIPFRPFDFAQKYSDRLGDQGALNVYASRLQLAAQERRRRSEPEKTAAVTAAVRKLVMDGGFLQKCIAGEAKRGRIQGALRDAAPPHILERDDPDGDSWKQPSMRWADALVDTALTEMFGAQGSVWDYGEGYGGGRKIRILDESAWRDHVNQAQVMMEREEGSAAAGHDDSQAPRFFDDEPPF